MTRISFPIDVVIIHRPDHVTIQKRGIDGIGFETGNKGGCVSFPTSHRAVMLQQDFGVVLLTAAQRAADGVEPE